MTSQSSRFPNAGSLTLMGDARGLVGTTFPLGEDPRQSVTAVSAAYDSLTNRTRVNFDYARAEEVGV